MLMQQHMGDAKWDKLISYMQKCYWFNESREVIDFKLKEYHLQVTFKGNTEFYQGINVDPNVYETILAIWTYTDDDSNGVWDVTIRPINVFNRANKPHARRRRGAIPDDVRF